MHTAEAKAKVSASRREQFAEQYPTGVRPCRACTTEKPLDQFVIGNRRRGLCKTCYRQDSADRAKGRYDSTLEQSRKTVRMKRYGLTEEQHDALMAITTCGICGESDQEMHIDHDHATGVVRGRICGLCNRALGLFRDDPARMRAAAEYIEKHRSNL